MSKGQRFLLTGLGRWQGPGWWDRSLGTSARQRSGAAKLLKARPGNLGPVRPWGAPVLPGGGKGLLGAEPGAHTPVTHLGPCAPRVSG